MFKSIVSIVKEMCNCSLLLPPSLFPSLGLVVCIKKSSEMISKHGELSSRPRPGHTARNKIKREQSDEMTEYQSEM